MNESITPGRPHRADGSGCFANGVATIYNEPDMRRMISTFAFVIALALTNAARGQADSGINPENVEKLPPSRPIIEYTVAGGVLLGALAIGFMPSKRTKEA